MRKLLPFTFIALMAVLPRAEAQNASWPPPLTVERQQLSDSRYWPGDPDFGGSWEQWGWTPDLVQQNPRVSQAEKTAGIGMGLDAAWQRSTGDHRVVIAVMDSGFLWDRPDVLNRWFLNRAELPPPDRTDCVGTDPYDCNGDGVFNLQDYTSATGHQSPSADKIADATLLARADHGDVNHNGWLDPQDLIAAFSDGVDNDGNGYVDDICGWDFLWDDNDAHDDVLNGGQGYSHGTGEVHDSAAEGNNGIGGVGSCPDCMLLPLRTGDSFLGQASHQAMAIFYANARGASVMQLAQPTFSNTPFEQDAITWAFAHGTLLVASSADETSLHQMYPSNLEHVLTVDGHHYDGKSWSDPDNTTFVAFSNGTNWGGHIALSSCASSSSEATGRISGIMGLIFSYAKQLDLSPPLSPAEAYQVATQTTFDIDVPGSGELKHFSDGGSGYTEMHAGPGWDAHFGYGRPDARNALDLLASGKIPPAVELTAPLWFDVFDPQRVPTLAIAGAIDASRASSVDYVVEAAYGLEPTDDQFHAIASSSGSGKLPVAVSVDTASLIPDPSGVPGVDPRTYPNGGPHKYAVTLRIRATAHYGDQGDARGEARKTIFVHRDDDLLPGFPMKLAHRGEAGEPSASGEPSPKLVDLDGDGKDEIVLATADGYLHVFRVDQTELPGFPVRLGRSRLLQAHPDAKIDPFTALEGYQEIVATPAIGDLDGDGKPEIVVSTLEGEVHVLGLDGREKPGFPVGITAATLPDEVPNDVGGMQRSGIWTVSDPGDGGARRVQMNELERGFFASPVLADIDGDGKLDIVQAGMDAYIHVWKAGGAEAPGFPVEVRDPRGGTEGDHALTIRGRIIATPAVGDVDGDGKPEILSGSNEAYENKTVGRAYLIKSDGSFAPNWPIAVPGLYLDVLPYVGRGNPDNPLIADVDGDGKPELFTHVVATEAKAFDVAGNEVLKTQTTISAPSSTATSRQPVSLIAVNSGAVADLDGDGMLEYVDGTIAALDLAGGAGGAKRHDYDHQVVAWSVGKSLKAAKAHGEEAQAGMLPAFPQLTSDYQFLTNYVVADIDGDGLPEIISGNGGYLITAFDKDGKQPAGWPKLTGTWNMATPAVGDVDGDGKLDVVAVSRGGYLWAWKTTAPANGNVQWESYHHDLHNSGDFATPLVAHHGPVAQAPVDDGKKKGCGCGDADPAFAGLVLVALGFLRRRARR